MTFVKLQQKDYIALGVAVFVGIILAVAANKFLFSTSAQGAQVDEVPTIKTTFPSPPSQYFNAQSIDPTQIINVSPNDNTQPFNSSGS